MPDFGERNLCSEKIFIPPSFPSIMKGYCKAAIRTQPYDLLRWSAAYFRALANGENPPVKERLEFPSKFARPGLTPGYLKVLVNQLGRTADIVVTTEIVTHKWIALCLPAEGLDPLLSLIGTDNFQWIRFVAVAAGSISSSLTQTMIVLCELLTEDPEGGKAAIPLDVFLDLYQFLAYLDCVPGVGKVTLDDEENINGTIHSPIDGKAEVERSPSTISNTSAVGEDIGTVKLNESDLGVISNSSSDSGNCFSGIGPKLPVDQVQKVVEFMEHWAGRQEGMVMPRNIRHWMCPPLDNSSQLELRLSL